MIVERRKYYHEMIKRDRLMPIIVEGRFAGMITFYLTDNEIELDNIDSWEILEDNPKGKVVSVRQMVTDFNLYNSKFSFKTLKNFITYLKNKFPQVKYIHWRRWNKKNNIIKVYKKEI